MIEVPLTQGQVALIDDEDSDLANFRWSAQCSNGRWYAKRCERQPGRKSPVNVYLHREVLIAPRGLHVDHINGDSLDCRRANLRVATPAENMRNRGLHRTNRSGFKGVSAAENTSDKRWRADIRVNGKQHYLGCFDTREAAAAAYDRAALELHGDFARTNRALGTLQ